MGIKTLLFLLLLLGAATAKFQLYYSPSDGECAKMDAGQCYTCGQSSSLRSNCTSDDNAASCVFHKFSNTDCSGLGSLLFAKWEGGCDGVTGVPCGVATDDITPLWVWILVAAAVIGAIVLVVVAVMVVVMLMRKGKVPGPSFITNTGTPSYQTYE